MNEVTNPAIIPAATAGNLTNLISERAWFEPERITMSRPLGDGWQPLTARQVEEEIRATAKGLVAAGIAIGDRVAIMARTRYEWTILDFAIWYAGGCVVPIYETSSAEQVDWILNDSASVGLIVETPTHKELVNSVLPSHTKHVWVMTDDVLSTLRKAGTQISDDEIDRRRNALIPDTLATLIYTSGTTGRPKGVQLTHGNFLAECGNVVEGASDLFLKPGGSTLLFLPVAHVFGRMVEIGAIHAGLHLAHCSDPVGRLQPDLASFKPTFVLAVPRIFEKIYNGAEAKADAACKGKILERRQRSPLPIARRKISVDSTLFSLSSTGSLTSLSTQRFAQQWVEKLRQLSLVAHHWVHVLATSIAELESPFLKDMDLLKLQQVQLLTSQRIFASVQ